VQVIRSRPEANFTQILNAVIRDPQLDPMTLGILCRMLSHADGWTTTADTMWQQARKERPGSQHGEGRRAYRAAFALLEAAGYLERRRLRTKTGRFETCLILHDSPATATEVPLTDVPLSVPRFPPAETPRLPRSDRRTAYATSVSGTSFRTPTTEHVKHGSSPEEHGWPPGGAQPDGSAALTDRIVQDVRAAISAVYGEADNDNLADEEVLGLWEACKPQDGRKVRSPRAYMSKIFEDTPDISSLLAKFQDSAGNPYDDGTEDGQYCPTCYIDGHAQVHAQVSGFCAWHEETHGLAGARVS
jgi:hypothetical protein